MDSVSFRVCVYVLLFSIIVQMWRSENSLQELVLCFHHVGPGDETQVIVLGGKHLLPTELSPRFWIQFDYRALSHSTHRFRRITLGLA